MAKQSGKTNGNNDMFGDETKGREDDFGSLFEQSLNGSKVKQGDGFKGEILSIGKETVYVSTGSPVDGQLPTTEILDETNKPKFKVGEIIEVVVLKVRENEIFLRYKHAKSGSANLDNLEDAFDMELPVEGKVLELVKGGFRVEISGNRAFCPLSQIDLRQPQEPESFVGRKFEFIITAYEKDGRNIVISRRKILEQGQAEEEGKMLEKAQVGDLYEGTITRLEKFGAFVRLENNLEGLIPVSELSWSRGVRTEDVVQVGTTVRVKLLKIEELDGRLRMSFSLKQGGGESDPWQSVMQNYPVGKVFEGTVEKKEVYGLFVNIGPAVTGLLPKSKWRDSTEGAQYENKKRGDKIQVQVDEIKMDERKLSLGLPGEGRDDSWKEHASAKSGFGTFGDLLKDFGKRK
jgi:small subunit ribosomal protein S1